MMTTHVFVEIGNDLAHLNHVMVHFDCNVAETEANTVRTQAQIRRHGMSD
jgi:hypothetical protein